MLNEAITWLNSKFPTLPRWHEWLLVIAALVSAGCSLVMLRGGQGWGSLGPGLLLLILVWRPMPTRWWTRTWWLIMVAGFLFVFTEIIYTWCWLHLHGLR